MKIKKILSFSAVLMNSSCLFAQTIPNISHVINQDNGIEQHINIDKYQGNNIDSGKSLNDDFITPSLIDIEVAEVGDVDNALNGKLDDDLNSETNSLVPVNPGAKFFLSNDTQWSNGSHYESSSKEYSNSGFSVVSSLIAPTPCMFSRTTARAVVIGGSALLPSLFERSSIESIELGKAAKFSRGFQINNGRGEELGRILTFKPANIGIRGVQFGSIAFADSSRNNDGVKIVKEIKPTEADKISDISQNASLFCWTSWFNSYWNPSSSDNIKKESIASSILGIEANKASVAASIVQDKAIKAKGEEKIQLLEETIKAKRVHEAVIDKVIESETAVLVKAIDEETKKQWAEKLQQSQNIKETIASSILRIEASKANEAASIVQNKAIQAKGEEKIQLLEEAIKIKITYEAAIDKVIESETAALVKAIDEETKKQWIEKLQQYQNIKEFIASSILGIEANKASEAASIVQDKATKAKGEEKIQLLEEAIKANITYEAVIDKVIESETAALAKAIDEKTKKQWTEKLQQSQNIKESIASNILGIEANKASAAVAIAHNKANRADGEEAIRLWDEVIKAVRAHIAAQDKVIESETAALAKAIDEKTKKQWTEKLRQSRNIKESIASNILGIEANKANLVVSIAHNKANKADGEEAIRLWDEVIKAARIHIAAQDKVIESETAALAKAIDETTKKQWIEKLQQSRNIKESIASSILGIETIKANLPASIVQNKARTRK
ncbi:MAG TPA: hypothetical protein VJK54_07700 [Chthoniobacterales bacterium]|nr:hypothetical protein [Chthoniobacterales bacterium]